MAGKIMSGFLAGAITFLGGGGQAASAQEKPDTKSSGTESAAKSDKTPPPSLPMLPSNLPSTSPADQNSPTILLSPPQSPTQQKPDSRISLQPEGLGFDVGFALRRPEKEKGFKVEAFSANLLNLEGGHDSKHDPGEKGEHGEATEEPRAKSGRIINETGMRGIYTRSVVERPVKVEIEAKVQAGIATANFARTSPFAEASGKLNLAVPTEKFSKSFEPPKISGITGKVTLGPQEVETTVYGLAGTRGRITGVATEACFLEAEKIGNICAKYNVGIGTLDEAIPNINHLGERGFGFEFNLTPPSLNTLGNAMRKMGRVFRGKN